MQVEEINKVRKIHIVYCCDDKFVPVMATSLLSVLENKGCEDIYAHIISNGISDQNVAFLKKIINRFTGSLLYVYPFPNIEEQLGCKIHFNKRHVSISTYGRLFISSVLPNTINRVIYLDCDTIVLKSLKDLYDVDLNGKTIGGVDDCKSERYRWVLGLDPEDSYINAGVLLIDVWKWRHRNCEQRLMAYIRHQRGEIHFEDQGAINVVFKDEIMELPLNYNVMTHLYALSYNELKILRNPRRSYKEYEIRDVINSATIIHFTSCFIVSNRVWVAESNHMKKDIFDHYYNRVNRMDSSPKHISRASITSRIITLLPRKLTIKLAGFIHEELAPKKARMRMAVARL